MSSVQLSSRYYGRGGQSRIGLELACAWAPPASTLGAACVYSRGRCADAKNQTFPGLVCGLQDVPRHVRQWRSGSRRGERRRGTTRSRSPPCPELALHRLKFRHSHCQAEARRELHGAPLSQVTPDRGQMLATGPRRPSLLCVSHIAMVLALALAPCARSQTTTPAPPSGMAIRDVMDKSFSV